MEKYPLKVRIPEELGIPSAAISRFTASLEEQNICMHSFILARHGEIAAEAYYAPFNADFKHRMYSTSKTFVAAAIGLLYDEGKIKLTDKIVDYFPEYIPEDPHPYLMSMTIRDLLMMSTCRTTNAYGEKDKDWVWCFFNKPVTHPSGSLFMYDTSATVTLNALVEKLSGKLLLDYMRPGLLDPIGFSSDAWCVERPEGGSWGGSGVICTTRDLLKFALVLHNGGRYGDKQLISEDYISQATTKQIDNRITASGVESSFGYGYQIWCGRNGSFMTLGMGSQIALCVPDKDIVLVTTADTQILTGGHDRIIRAFWEIIYPSISDSALPVIEEDAAALKKTIAELRMLRTRGELSSPASSKYSGVNYKLEPNRMEISDISFTLGEKTGKMEYIAGGVKKSVSFGFGSSVLGSFPQDNYYGKKIGVLSDERYKYASSAAWGDDNTLIIYLYIIDDYFGTLKINVSFRDDTIVVMMQKAAEWFLNEYHGIAIGKAEKTDGEVK